MKLIFSIHYETYNQEYKAIVLLQLYRAIFLTLNFTESVWNTDNTSLSEEEICQEKKACALWAFKVIISSEIHLLIPNEYPLVICPKGICVCTGCLYACSCCKAHSEEGVRGYSQDPLELNCSLLGQVHFHSDVLRGEFPGHIFNSLRLRCDASQSLCS